MGQTRIWPLSLLRLGAGVSAGEVLKKRNRKQMGDEISENATNF